MIAARKNSEEPFQSWFTSTLGAIVRIRARVSMMDDFSVYLSKTALPAIMTRQIEVFYASDLEPMGYVMWAYLSDDVSASMEASPGRGLHESEWNEGIALWIIDLVVVPGKGRKIARSVRDKFSAYSRLRLLRQKRGDLKAISLGKSSMPEFAS